ncbi:MAG TPA: hypothetical protein VFN13_09445 [Rudaea sp.]|nr:hypothetical protein [Rudaea sp.]
MGTVILYVLVMFIIGLSICAGILMLSTRIAAGFTPKFLLAIATVVISAIAATVVRWVLGMVMGLGAATSLVALIVLFLVNAFVLNALIKRPDGAQIGFGSACLVTLLQIILYIVLGVIVFVVFGTAMMGMIGASMVGAP